MYKLNQTRAAMLHGNRTMQRVFPMPSDSLISICFSLLKVRALQHRQSFID